MPTVQRAAIVFANGKPGAFESDGTNNYVYLQNLLSGLNYFETNAKYIYTILNSGTTVTTPSIKTFTAVQKNGVKVTGTLTFTVTSGSFILAVSKTQGAGGTVRSTGNSLIYVAGVDADNSKNFNVYEVAQTIDQLYTALTT